MFRVAIGGSCRTGKTTYAKQLAEELGIPLRHTDEVVGQGPTMFWQWGGIVADWFDEPGPWIIEGVRVGPALRHRQGFGKAPSVDQVIWMQRALVPLTDDQIRFNRKLNDVRALVDPYLNAYGIATKTVSL